MRHAAEPDFYASRTPRNTIHRKKGKYKKKVGDVYGSNKFFTPLFLNLFEKTAGYLPPSHPCSNLLFKKISKRLRKSNINSQIVAVVK